MSLVRLEKPRQSRLARKAVSQPPLEADRVILSPGVPGTSGCSQVVWRLIWDQEVVGSIPATQTIMKKERYERMELLLASDARKEADLHNCDVIFEIMKKIKKASKKGQTTIVRHCPSLSSDTIEYVVEELRELGYRVTPSYVLKEVVIEW